MNLGQFRHFIVLSDGSFLYAVISPMYTGPLGVISNPEGVIIASGKNNDELILNCKEVNPEAAIRLLNKSINLEFPEATIRKLFDNNFHPAVSISDNSQRTIEVQKPLDNLQLLTNLKHYGWQLIGRLSNQSTARFEYPS